MPPRTIATAFRHAALLLAAIASLITSLFTNPAAAQDAYPIGTVAFFNAQSCPAGWGPAPALNGVTLVPFTSIPPGAEASSVNTPLTSGQPPLHTHNSLLSTITLRSNRYGGAVGHGDHSTSASGTLPVNGSTGYDDANIPYLQLLVCTKQMFPSQQTAPVAVPPGVAALVLATTCPPLWKPFAAGNGRFLVGLPAGGTPGTPFGGPALTSIGANNIHSHAISGSFNIPSTSVALAPCCDGSFGSKGTYPFQGITSSAIIPFPYAAASQCLPCAANDPDLACKAP